MSVEEAVERLKLSVRYQHNLSFKWFYQAELLATGRRTSAGPIVNVNNNIFTGKEAETLMNTYRAKAK